MTATITSDVLEAFVKCRYKAYLKLGGQAGDRSDYAVMMANSRDDVRKAAADLLLLRYRGNLALRGVLVTPELLCRQIPLLLDAIVERDGLAVRFDALLLQSTRSGPNRQHYVPVLFHECTKPGREQRAYLEILGLIIGAAQGTEPELGILIHGSACVTRRVKLVTGRVEAHRSLAVLRQCCAHGVVPRLILNKHCQVCEFRQRCHTEAVAKDSLSLLGGINETDIAKFARRGILTITQLAHIFHPPRKARRGSPRGNPHYHSLKALAVRDKKIFILGSPDLPDTPIRVYLDIEGDPDRGFDYLLGMIVESGQSEEQHSFWADTPADEYHLFRQFLQVLGRYKDFQIYCYGRYEEVFLRRMIKASGQPHLVDHLLPRLLNVLSVVHQHVYFPVYSNGLKDIGAYLGFRWTEEGASGAQSIVWRRGWEKTGFYDLKKRLVTYNLEDCLALRKLTECLYSVSQPRPAIATIEPTSFQGRPVSTVVDGAPRFRRPSFCKPDFAVPDFAFANDRAHFDYQRDRVYLRTNPALRRHHARQLHKRRKRNLRPNRRIVITTQKCPRCGGCKLSRTRDSRLTRVAYDLRFGRTGLRRHVSWFRSDWHHCAGCRLRFVPSEYVRLREYCHALMAWAMYKHVAHRASFRSISEEAQDCFGIPVDGRDIQAFKSQLSSYYEEAYGQLLAKIVAGPLLHADETEVVLRDRSKGYVWVFTNMEEVAYIYRPSRDGAFLHELFRDFTGVLVSDFYLAYESLCCPQQKCLVHLIRDLNHDVVANPWDEELKALAADFGSLLRTIVATIDLHGLKTFHLRRHRATVDAFFDAVGSREYQSEPAAGYCKRLTKYRQKLFTFLSHDGVPWNNNNAEHAIKGFADYRELVNGMLTKTGLETYLVLLSLSMSCKYKNVSLLRFLLSGQMDIDTFRIKGYGGIPSDIEMYPEGSVPIHASRRKFAGMAQNRQSWRAENPGNGCP